MEELGSASYNTELLQLYTVADSPSKALDLLEKMYQDRDANIPYMSTIFYSSHGPYQIEDPRFDSLLKKMNLPLRGN
jgi:hypothetical protein